MGPKSTFLFFQDALLTVCWGKMGPKGACTVALNPMTPAAFPAEVGCFRHRGVAGGGTGLSAPYHRYQWKHNHLLLQYP